MIVIDKLTMDVHQQVPWQQHVDWSQWVLELGSHYHEVPKMYKSQANWFKLWSMLTISLEAFSISKTCKGKFKSRIPLLQDHTQSSLLTQAEVCTCMSSKGRFVHFRQSLTCSFTQLLALLSLTLLTGLSWFYGAQWSPHQFSRTQICRLPLLFIQGH